MKKLIIILILLNLVFTSFSQERPTFDISLPKHEFYMISGMIMVGFGSTLKPVPQLKPSYLYPQVTIPITIGISLTAVGLFEGIRLERKRNPNRQIAYE